MRLFFTKLSCLLLVLLCATGKLLAQTGPCDVLVSPQNGKVNFCEGDQTTLTATVGANVTSFEWYKDGVQTGNTSSTISVSQSGTYYIIAKVNNCGPDPTKTSNKQTIAFSAQPLDPVFSTSPDASGGNTCAGTEITFSLKAPEPSGVDYIWNFGDGTPSVRTTGSQTVPHTFQASGTGVATFPVTVEAINQTSGCSASYIENVSVVETPEISFTEKSGFEVCLPDSVAPSDTTVTIELTNATMAPYLSDIRTYFVDWGDGKETSYPGQPSPFPLTSPELDTLGSYPVRVRAINMNGCETVFEQVFKYQQKPKANFTTNKEPVGTPQSCTPVIWAFGDSSTGGDVTYEWEIIDQMNIGGWKVVLGESLKTDTLRVQFDNSGVFQVQLVVSNSCGSDTTSQSVVVGYPQAQLGGSVTACGDTTIKYNAQNVFFDTNFGNTIKYEWFINGAIASTAQFPSLNFPSPGTYNVEVRITNECGSSDDLGQKMPPQVVTILPIPGAPVISDVTTCAGDSALLAPSGPGTTYNFYDNGGNLVFTGPSYSTPPLTGDRAYQVETIDGNNCPSDRVTVNVRVVPAIDNNTVTPVTQSICNGDTPGKLTGTQPTGGASGSYTYLWQTSTTGPGSGFTQAAGTNNSPDYTPGTLSRTTWFRRIVSSGTCTADTSTAVKVTVVPRIENNTISASQEICADEQPAPLTGTKPSGGDGSNYTITWEVSTTGPTSGFVPAPGINTGENYTPDVLTQDSWFRRVVESAGCRVVSEPVQISVLPALKNNTIAQDQTVCRGTAPAPLAGSAPTGGNGKYTYLWESSTISATAGFAAAAGTNNGQSYTPGAISRTTWYRRIITTGSCKPDTSAAVQVSISPGVQNNSIMANQTICAGQTPKALTGTVPTGGSGSYTYVWQSSTAAATSGFVNASGNNSGAAYTPQAITKKTWFRRIVMSSGCSDTSATVVIDVLPVPASPTLTTRDATACVNNSATLTVQNPDNSLNYEWYTDPTGGAAVFVGSEYQTPPLTTSTTYYVQAVNSSGCASSARTPVAVRVVTPQADAGPDVEIIQHRTIELRASGGVTYHWEPAEGLSNPDVANPVASPDETTTYTVTVTTAEGCSDTDDVTVTVIPAVIAPNAFTPNHDGVNEVWEIENIQNYPDARVEVFNRWGSKVFSSNGYGTPWDGTYNGQELPVATYYYMIFLNSTEKPISGNVTIIR